jgi:hypothetical protein
VGLASNGVSNGWTERRLLTRPQSPQPRRSVVDHDALRWRRYEPALALPAELGRARLLMDQHGDTGDVGEVLLRFDDPLA